MVKLSKRLSHLADMVSENSILADVGTDHGYIPVCLVQTNKIAKAFAMDIKKGPLLRAKEHIETYGLGDYITTRLSDGVAALLEGEADSILIAGMGGGVTLHILQDGEAVIASAKELILQPQSDIAKVREYIYRKGYVIDREDMVFEDGKYYPMMHVDLTKQLTKPEQDRYLSEDGQVLCRYGECLLRDKNEVLHRFLQHIISQQEQILLKLSKIEQTEAVILRIGQIEEKLACAKLALAYF